MRRVDRVVPHLPQFQSEMASIGHIAGGRQLADWLSIMRAVSRTRKVTDSFCALLIERVAAHQPTLAALDLECEGGCRSSGVLSRHRRILPAHAGNVAGAV